MVSLNLDHGPATMTEPTMANFLDFILEFQNDLAPWSSHLGKIDIGGLTGTHDGRLKMRQFFPIQSSVGEQVKGCQPAGFWIGVRVRSDRLQSLVLEHRAGSACGWAQACGGSCSCSHSEGAYSSYLSSSKKKE